MADVEQIEHAVGKDDFGLCGALPFDECDGVAKIQDSHTFKTYLNLMLGENDQRCAGRKIPTSWVRDFTRNV